MDHPFSAVEQLFHVEHRLYYALNTATATCLGLTSWFLNASESWSFTQKWYLGGRSTLDRHAGVANRRMRGGVLPLGIDAIVGCWRNYLYSTWNKTSSPQRTVRSLGKRDGLRGTGDDAGVAAVRYSMSTRWFGICGSRVGRRRGAAAEPTMCLAGCPPRLAVLALGQVCDGRLAANLTLRLCPARVEHRPVSTNRDRRRLRF